MEKELEILFNENLTDLEKQELIGISSATLARRKRKLGFKSKRKKSPGSGPKPGIKLPVNCPVCGKEKFVSPNIAHRRICCSRKCRYKDPVFIEQCKSVDRSYVSKALSGRIINPNLPEYKKYCNKVHRLTSKIYKENIDIINPNNFPRTICGVDGGYQLDHIEPIKECFDAGKPAEYCARIDNLRMLPWRENLMRNYAKV